MKHPVQWLCNCCLLPSVNKRIFFKSLEAGYGSMLCFIFQIGFIQEYNLTIGL